MQSVPEIYRDLVALRDEFETVKVDLRRYTFAVRTDRIVLEGIDPGAIRDPAPLGPPRQRRVLDPKYLYVTYLLDDGRVATGRPVGVNREQLTIELDPLTGESVSVPRAAIEASRPAEVSPMPTGLIDTLSRQEILDLIALLRR